ncbi:DUF4446 family protein [Clostridium sp. D53t1_180928_C8]|uniref:DUF4446 family protein n=1 Tax=Clostridium sp. D53t1_180928_C8 TaxID=2787101 RepID=UPI0018AC7B58|nr:DUF4446 family protein [Clostridium sp. D53t1_180928_C8]
MDSIINMINEYSIFIIIGLAIITLLLFVITIVLLSSVNKLEKKYRKMMRGVNNKNLEQALNDNLDNIEKALIKSQEAIDKCQNISEELKGCVNKVAIMRYKAFEDVGSDLSFSIAILDSYNDGVIITGIYSRHDSTTYAKPIDKGISRYDLSEEELHVLNEAINSKN